MLPGSTLSGSQNDVLVEAEWDRMATQSDSELTEAVCHGTRNESISRLGINSKLVDIVEEFSPHTAMCGTTSRNAAFFCQWYKKKTTAAIKWNIILWGMHVIKGKEKKKLTAKMMAVSQLRVAGISIQLWWTMTRMCRLLIPCLCFLCLCDCRQGFSYSSA